MSPDSVQEAKSHIQRVIDLLRKRAADDPNAEMLEDRLALMDGWFATKEQLFQIGELCHPKGLGDRFIPGMTAYEWVAEIDSLKQDCARAFNELERDGPN
jgi:hypothetical protein